MYSEYGDRYGQTMYVDLKGKPVERTKDEYPYSYSSYVVWKNDYIPDECEAVYSDRLWQWDSDKYNRCCQAIWGNKGQYFDNRAPEDIEKFLSMYFGKQVTLTAIMEGCNSSNGYPIWTFFFK